MLFETAKHVDWNCPHMYMFLLVKYLIFLLYIAVIDLITFLQSQIIFFLSLHSIGILKTYKNGM